ncbi:MAG: outer membrane beta-barrel protein, partial [Pseudomonadales bacterium]|nr:outer membrane beta-barrel protein [Pseudomonadales bacterium]
MNKKIGLIIVTTWLFNTEIFADETWACDIRQGNKTTQENFDPCGYIGAGYGLTYLDPDRNNSSWTIEDKYDSGSLIYGGYHFKPHGFADIAYLNLGKVSATDKNPLRDLSGTIRYTVPTVMLGYYVDIPSLTNNLIPDTPIDTFIKLGISSIGTQSNPSTIPVVKKSNVQLAFGFGVEWRFQQHWKLRSQY